MSQRGAVGTSIDSSATSPGMITTGTPRLAMASRIAMSRVRPICATVATGPT
ncbi:hypothetical protein [Methylobacterium sp. 4-46]|uniref:hypothetical protein n=1 Tax=unclassified Methylobacterium TaxID=2615210 RepID=UPI0039F5C65D